MATQLFTEPGKSRTILSLIAAMAAGMCLWFMTAAVLPDIVAEAGISPARQALLSSAVQAGFVLGALVIALSGLADRLDPRRVLLACALGSAMANAGLLVVPIGSGAAVFLRFLTGALMAGVYPVGMKIAVGWGVRDRGLLVGLLVGALTAGKSIPYLLAWLGGADWRLALGSASVLAALGGLLVLRTELGPHHARVAGFRPRAILVAWTNRDIRAAYLGYFGHMWELYILWAWIGTMATLSYEMQIGREAAVPLGKLTAFMAIAAGAPVCIWAGVLADRIGKARVAITALAASASLALICAFAFGGPVWLVFPLLVLWGIAVIPDSAQFSALVADRAPSELAGSLLTLQTALGFLLTVFTVQFAPWAAELLGWRGLMAVLAIGPALGVLAMLPLWRAGR